MQYGQVVVEQLCKLRRSLAPFCFRKKLCFLQTPSKNQQNQKTKKPKNHAKNSDVVVPSPGLGLEPPEHKVALEKLSVAARKTPRGGREMGCMEAVEMKFDLKAPCCSNSVGETFYFCLPSSAVV